MRLGKCQVENFGSYRKLEFDFSDTGLCLLYGRTGSGKSTLPDVVAWILFGTTAKNGNADEVRSWLAPDEFTTGILHADDIIVYRHRGTSKQNDLYWLETNGEVRRGKDLAETQKLLEERLGVTADLYLMSAYFSEFSPTASFFMAKAKDRRELLEAVAPLELPIRLSGRSSEVKKAAKKELEQAELSLSKLTGKLEQLNSSYDRSESDLHRWETEQNEKINLLTKKQKTFDATKASKIVELESQSMFWQRDKDARMDALVTKLESLAASTREDGEIEFDLNRAERQVRKHSKSLCPTCGSPCSNPDLELARADVERLKEERQIASMQRIRFEAGKSSLIALQESQNPFIAKIEAEKASEDRYKEIIVEELDRENPFLEQFYNLQDSIRSAERNVKTQQTDVDMLRHKIASLTTLYDLSLSLRGELLKKAVKEIETETNRVLEQHFDAEIRIQFALEGSDSLQVEIFKGGYGCVYRQLSKGQRGLLKLAFGVAVMKSASNKAGKHFSVLQFDESLDGLDTDMKIKAFNLFEELSLTHSSVLVIDHCQEFQNMFGRRFMVTILNDESRIEEQT